MAIDLEKYMRQLVSELQIQTTAILKSENPDLQDLLALKILTELAQEQIPHENFNHQSSPNR